MRQRPTPQWERKLRKIGSNLVDGIRNIFGSSEAVAYQPPKPEPKHEDAPHHEDHPHALTPSSADNRLPPRERRGRD
jgi:hypothetical protein